MVERGHARALGRGAAMSSPDAPTRLEAAVDGRRRAGAPDSSIDGRAAMRSRPTVHLDTAARRVSGFDAGATSTERISFHEEARR